MRRARFYLLVLSLTLLPQVLAARHLVGFLRAQDDPRLHALGWTVPGLLFALNVPMAFEIAGRKRKALLPPALAAVLQTGWTAWWLGGVLYAVVRGIFSLGAALVWLVQPGPRWELPLWLALAPFALSFYGAVFGARALQREKVTVPVAGLPPQFRGLRIVQLSDLHSGRHVTAARLRRIARRAARLQPDVLVVTGGVDEPWSDRLDLDAALRDRPEGAATVLLSHQPNTWPLAQAAGVHLQLSGHTHGGQLAMLWLHRSLSLARLITPFVAGLYRAGESYLYVNRGAGSVMPLARIGARPEVTDLTLVSPRHPPRVTPPASPPP